MVNSWCILKLKKEMWVKLLNWLQKTECWTIPIYVQSKRVLSKNQSEIYHIPVKSRIDNNKFWGSRMSFLLQIVMLSWNSLGNTYSTKLISTHLNPIKIVYMTIWGLNWGYPKMDALQWKFLFKWMTWATPHFQETSTWQLIWIIMDHFSGGWW